MLMSAQPLLVECVRATICCLRLNGMDETELKLLSLTHTHTHTLQTSHEQLQNRIMIQCCYNFDNMIERETVPLCHHPANHLNYNGNNDNRSAKLLYVYKVPQ